MSISRVTLSLSSRCHGHSQESQDIQSFPRKQKQKQTALLHKEGTGRALPGTRAGAQCVRATPSLPPLHRWRFHGEFSKRLLKRSFEPHSNCVRGSATLSVRRRRCFAAGPGWGGGGRAEAGAPLWSPADMGESPRRQLHSGLLGMLPWLVGEQHAQRQNDGLFGSHRPTCGDQSESQPFPRPALLPGGSREHALVGFQNPS